MVKEDLGHGYPSIAYASSGEIRENALACAMHWVSTLQSRRAG